MNQMITKAAILSILLITLLAIGCTGTPSQSPVAPSSDDGGGAEWRITRVSQAETASGLGNRGDAGGARYSFQPKSQDDIFLLVEFQLEANSGARTLDVQDIILVVDTSARFYPVGYAQFQSEYVGKFTGTISPEAAELHVDFEVAGTPGAPGGGRGLKTSLGAPFTFIYIVPRQYVDGKHRLSLQLNGSATAAEFTVPALP